MAEDGAKLLELRALTKRFGGLAAVTDVSFDVRAAEIHALIGPNGAGKSTLINLIAGDLAPSSGEVFLAGAPVTHLRADARARAGLGRSYQITTIFPSFTVFENVRLAAQLAGPKPFRLLARADADGAANTRGAAALGRIGLADRASSLAGTLSHGEQRQLELAMALANHPKVLLLDEPLAGMSPAESAQMVTLIGALRADLAVVLVEHDMDAVFAIADRLTVMVNGRVVATGAPDAVRADATVRTAYLGDSAGGARPP